MKRFIPFLLLALCGCSLFPSRIKIGDASVTPPKDNGTAATLSTMHAGETLPLAAGSRLVITRYHASAAIPATKDQPAVAAQPEKTVTEVIPAKDTQWERTEAAVSANSGTVDTSIAAKKIDAAESRPLLYGALLAAVGAGFFLWAKYPTPALACGIASIVFFMAWKVSGLPEWFWAVGLLAAGVAGALYLGHEKGELHAASLSTMGQPKEPTQ